MTEEQMKAWRALAAQAKRIKRTQRRKKDPWAKAQPVIYKRPTRRQPE